MVDRYAWYPDESLMKSAYSMLKPTAAVVTLLLSLLYSCESQEKATLVIMNANIYTVDDHNPVTQAVAVMNDRIVFVGTNREVQKFIGPITRRINLHGATVVPGLTDAHYHFLAVGQREASFDLGTARSLKDLLKVISRRVKQKLPGEWIVGRGWIETAWKSPKFPSRWDIDRVAPGNPVALLRADGHTAVLNSMALKLSSISQNTPDPFGGRILRSRDSVSSVASGTAPSEPNGVLLDRALVLIKAAENPSSDAEAAAIAADQRSVEAGWCEVHDAGGGWEDVELYRRLLKSGKLRIRIYKAISGPGDQADRLIRNGVTVGEFNHHLTVRTIKVIADGALGSRGAALIAPYSDDPRNSGFLTVREQELRPMLIGALRSGVQVEMHAIGDRANRFLLDEYERAFMAVSESQRKIRSPRWRDEHAQVVAPVDLPRFVKLGVIPSMQPSHAIDDLFFAASRIGLERIRGAYAWQSLRRTGSIIAAGSDAPVESGDPVIEFYAAVVRRPLPKAPRPTSWDGWHREESLSREDALKMLTIWPAYAAFEETLRGSITAGKLADFTILSADLMKVPELRIPKVRVLMTIIGGNIVYDHR